MACALEEALEIKCAAAESGRGLGLCRREVMRQCRLVRGDANTAAAAAGTRFEHHREADFARRGRRLVEIGDFALAARHDWNARFQRRRPRRGLVAHLADGRRRRPHEDNAGCRHRFGEPRVLGKKPISGVDRARPGLPRGRDDGVGFEIAFGRRRGTDADRLVGEAHRETVLIRFAEHGDGAQPELFRRADDAHGDLAAIGYQKLVEHAEGSGSLDQHHRLSRFDRRFVVDEKACDLAARVGLNLGELFHDLYQADHVALGNAIAVLLVGRLLRRWSPIKNAG